MHTKGPKEDPLVDLGYEVRDIDTRLIEKSVMWFFTFATVMFIVGAWIYANINPAFSPKYIAEKERLIIPKSPNPLLQTNSTNVTDIMHIREHETAVLKSTGYGDPGKTFAHIPIDQAMEILAKRGLPPTSADVPAVSKGNTTDERKNPVPAGAVPAPGSVAGSNASGVKEITTSPDISGDLPNKPTSNTAPKTTPKKQ